MNPIGTKPITTQRLYLRAPRLTDTESLVRIKSLAMTMEEARRTVAAMLEEQKHTFNFHWVITLDGAIIGRIKGWEISPYNGYLQLGYDMGPDFRGQGYMTEAVGAVIRYLMIEADANRVYCSVREGNLASRRVCEKCGMKHEGVLRQHYARQDGGFDNVYIYGILKSDLNQGE